jgi:hypothetical protein
MGKARRHQPAVLSGGHSWYSFTLSRPGSTSAGSPSQRWATSGALDQLSFWATASTPSARSPEQAPATMPAPSTLAPASTVTTRCTASDAR